MSYCVNCGVELAASEPECPLCQTPVNNPRQPYDCDAPKPFPPRVDVLEQKDTRFFNAIIITLLLALPAAICFACDVAYTNGAGWSMFVVGAMAMLWVFVVPVMFIRRHPVLCAAALDTGAILGYLKIVEHYSGGERWFAQLALPIVLLLLGLFALNYLLIKKVIRGRFKQAAAAVMSVTILLTGIEISVDRYLTGKFAIGWSYYVAIPCVIFALLLLVLNRQERFKSQMRKRLHM